MGDTDDRPASGRQQDGGTAFLVQMFSYRSNRRSMRRFKRLKWKTSMFGARVAVADIFIVSLDTEVFIIRCLRFCATDG